MGHFTPSPTVSLRSILGLNMLAALGSAHGLPVTECLSGSGVLEESLNDPSALVTVEQELQVIRNLLAKFGQQEGFGVYAGTRYHANAFGALGLALASSPNALSALAVALRFFNLTFALTRFEAATEGALTVVTIDDSLLPQALRRFVVERDAAVLSTVQRDLLSTQSALHSVDFAFAAPPYVKPYVDVFGVPPRFSAKTHVVRLYTDLLLQPFPQANPLAFKTAEKQCEQLLARLAAQAGLVSQVRELLAHNMADWDNMDAVARRFCVTPRTLRRRLQEEGSSFIQLRDEVRMVLAVEYLETSNDSIEGIAERLNYASPTSFIVAFKRWKGVTPLAYRMAQTRTGRTA